MSERNLDLPWRNDDPYPDVVLDSNGDEVASFMNNGDCDYAIMAINAHSDLVQALEALILTANLLHQNSEACAVMHHNGDFQKNGVPGWLRDTGKTIDDARAALAKAKALEQPVGAHG